MTATAITEIKAVEAGVALAPAAGDTGNGNSFDNTNGDVFLFLQNTHASATETFTVVAQNTSFDEGDDKGTVTAASQVYVVAALSMVLAGPFPKRVFNDAGGLGQVTYSGSGTPKIAAFKLSHMQKG